MDKHTQAMVMIRHEKVWTSVDKHGQAIVKPWKCMAAVDRKVHRDVPIISGVQGLWTWSSFDDSLHTYTLYTLFYVRIHACMHDCGDIKASV